MWNKARRSTVPRDPRLTPHEGRFHVHGYNTGSVVLTYVAAHVSVEIRRFHLQATNNAKRQDASWSPIHCAGLDG